MEALVIAVVGVVVVALATALAPRVGIAGPLALVAIGIAVSLLPFFPAFEVDPEIILVGVLLLVVGAGVWILFADDD